MTVEIRMSDSKKYREFVGESFAGKPVYAIPGIGPEIGKRMAGPPINMPLVSYEENVKIE